MKVLWKEWRQQRFLFLLFCAAGIAFPLFEVIWSWRRSGDFFSNSGSGVVLGIGTLFAILLSIATTNSDAKKGVDDFLLSKPVRIYKLFVAKIALAAALLWIAFLFVSVFDFASESKRGSIDFFTWTAVCYTYPIALMLFAVTMFLVVILRDTAKAVLMAIWVALVVYFLPLLVGRLEWMNIFEQLNNTYNRPSIVRYLIWVCSLPEKIMPGMSISRPAGIEVPVYKITRFQALWRIASSPEYSQYLLFVAVTTVVSVICVILSVKAMKNRWRWQPGQKTIVWTMGLSAAFIFGVAMTQVGHNLTPAKISDGQNTDSLIRFDTKPEHLYDWVNQENKSDIILDPEYSWANSQLCVDEGYLYKIGSVIKDYKHEYPVVRDWFIDIYQLPSIETGGKHLVKVRFFSTPPAAPNYHQQILANFIKDKILYIAYQPRLETGDDVRNPLRFLVADINDPMKPELLFDEIIYEPKRSGGRTKGSPSNFGDYCYIAFSDELVVISVAQENNPKVVNTISWEKLGLGESSWIPTHGLSVLPDKKIVCFDYHEIMLFNIENPVEPKKLFYSNFKPLETTLDRGDTIGVVTYDEDKIYISRESGIYIYQVAVDDTEMNSKMIGHRKSTPLERLVHRIPLQLLIHNRMLIEAASHLGIIVYDISDPTRPRRIYHGGDGRYISAIGFWDGILYGGNPHHTVGGYLNFFNIPNPEKDIQ